MELEELCGKFLNSVKISDSKRFLALFCANEEVFLLHADGDCCSNSWFDHIQMFSFDSDYKTQYQIKSVEEIEMGKVMDIFDESDKIYGLVITLQAPGDAYPSTAEIKIEMRNSSNGYYGGSFELSKKKDCTVFTDWKLLEETY